MSDRLGYALRFGLSLKLLHVSRWDVTPDGVLIVAACTLQVVYPTEPPGPAGLYPTAIAALQAMDDHQAGRLCPRCRQIFTKGTP